MTCAHDPLFGRDYGICFSILLAIAQGRTSRAETTAALGGMAIGGRLERLENTYNIISKFRPVMPEPGSKNTVRFRISKTLLRQYHPDVYRLIGHRYLELHKGLKAGMEEAAGAL